MKHCFVSLVNRYSQKNSRASLSGLYLVALLFLLVSCGGWDPLGLQNSNKPIDDAIKEVEQARKTIESESSGWRAELPKLENDLSGIESQASGDAQTIVVDATNQVRDLATETIAFTDAKAQDLIAQAGVEFRCNTEFVKAGAVAQLQSIEDDLKFWEQHNQHLGTKPIHAVCWINPTALSLYPSGNGWLINTSNMGGTNVMHVFGYNFWSDAMPTLELQDPNGQKIRNVNLTAGYVTHYQINLDFSNERFPEVRSGAKVVFRWPDQPDPNTINLILTPPAKLRLSNPVFSPDSPIMQKDPVALQVTITNQGGMRSGSFAVSWPPDPINDRYRVLTVTPDTPLEPGQSRTVSFPAYTFQQAGTITALVSLSNGDDTLTVTLTVKMSTLQRFEYLDSHTQDQDMQACPVGYAIAGLHYINGIVLCRRVIPAGEENYVSSVVDSNTQRSGMHACPQGTYVRGLHDARGLLLCSWDSRRGPHEWQTESVDSGSQQYGMHVCPRSGDYPTYLTGVAVGPNRFLCGVHYRTDTP